jgi:hypothetical protein
VLAVYYPRVAFATENQQSQGDELRSLREISLYLKRLWGQGRGGIDTEVGTKDVQVHLRKNEIFHGGPFATAPRVSVIK